MDPNTLADYDATRNFATKGFRSLCYAPYTSLYFDTRGDVRVCCHNWSHKVGNVAANTIAEMWNGAKLAQVRDAVHAYDFSQGCSYCEWQIASSNFVNLSIAKWDRLPVPSPNPEWPLQMEFSISNTCNLQCVMCNGAASSAIRANREHLPPLPDPYSNAFFEELRAYLPHLMTAKFLGGEPFLQEHCYRIWDMLIDDHIPLLCHVTTNGTVFNTRVQRVLENLPVGISVSLDGATKETVESIRVGASHEKLLANVSQFRAYCTARKTSFGLTFCLMRRNWQELGAFCLYADEMDCSVFVNSVRKPPEMSLYTLPLDELQKVVRTMTEQEQHLLPRLGRNRRVWTGQMQLLRQRALGAVQVPGVVLQSALTS